MRYGMAKEQILNILRFGVVQLEVRSVKCYFMGYSKQTLGYELYHPDDQKVFVARTTMFFEDEFVLNETGKKTIQLKEIPNELQTSNQQTDNQVLEPLVPRRSERGSRQPQRYGLDNNFRELHLLGGNDTNEDLRDYSKAMSDVNSKIWQKGMKFEMDFMYQNQV
ncbi:hypothetical protein ACFX1Z_014613 [Malus domestica]